MHQWEKPSFEKSPGKWLSRAMAYETILSEEGVEGEEKYVKRYLPKIDRLLEALWKLHQLKEKDARKKSNLRA